MLSSAPSSDVYRFPASFSQKAIWFIEQTNNGIRAYELVNGIAIRGQLDTDAMCQALQLVTNRHESLRCTFSDQGGQLWQIVRSESLADVQVANTPNINAAHEALDGFLDQRFDLTRDLLFRTLLVTVAEPEAGEPDAFVVLKFHHIIVDQMAIATLTQELSTVYDALVAGQQPQLEEQQLDYADFAIWQQDNITREATAPKLAFWKDRLVGPVGCINLPLDQPRGAHQAFTGSEVRGSLRPGLSGAIRSFSQANGVSVFTTLLTAYALTLGRYADEQLVIVGVPFGNRGADEALQDIVGLFINTLPVPIALDPAKGFLEQVQQVKQLFVLAQANQEVPVEFILEQIAVVRDPSYNPMFQVGFSFQPPPALPALSGLECVDMELHPHASPFDIQMWILDEGATQDLGVQVWYDDAILEELTIQRFIGAMETLLERATSDTTRPTRELSLVNGDSIMLRGPERDLEPSASTVPALLDLAGKPEDKVAIQVAGQSMTYGELSKRTEGVARTLSAMGVGAGQRVGVLLDRGIELLPTLLGILQSGACYVPLDPNYPRDLIAYVAQDAVLAALATTSGLAEKFDGVFSVPECRIDEQWSSLIGEPMQPATILPQAPAYVIYTSGSTGQPKGVEIPHEAAVNLLCAMLEKPGLQAQDHLLAVTTLSFDISVLELFGPLAAGATVTIATHDESRDAPVLKRIITDADINVLQATPSTWRLLVEQDFKPASGFRALCGGEPLPPDLAGELAERVDQLWNLYGPTETTVWSTISRVSDPQRVRIGQPLANTRLYIFDPSNLDVPVGVPGELCIAGKGLALGYVNRPELTAERFIEHPRIAGERLYRTGDLVRLDNNGEIEHLGRLDHQIKIRGFRVELGHIESALVSCPGVAEVVAHAKELTPGDKRLIAYVVAEQGANTSVNALRKSLRNSLPEYMVPQFFVNLDSIPRMANGKIDRAALPDPQELTRSTFEPPQGEMEVAVAAIWQELIGVKQIGRSDNFFAAGGHSLLAIKALSAIESATGVAYDLRALTTRSLADLCQYDPVEHQVQEDAGSSAMDSRKGSLFKRVKRMFKG